MVHVPDLRHQCLVRINHSFNFFLESPDDHTIGHDQRKREMSRHLFSYILRAIVQYEPCSPRMMLSECGGIKHVIIKNDQNFIIFLSVFLNVLLGFEFDVFLHCLSILLFIPHSKNQTDIKIEIMLKNQNKIKTKIFSIATMYYN